MRLINEAGQPTTIDDPQRVMWSSAHCGFWTDDWDMLCTTGVPACKYCGCPGYQTTMEDWDNGVDGYDDQHPGYRAFIDGIKNKCLGRQGLAKAMEEFFQKEV